MILIIFILFIYLFIIREFKSVMMTHSNLKKIDEKELRLDDDLKNGYNPMIEGVRWTERYADQMDRIWSHIPVWLGKIIVFISIFLLGSSIQGIYFLHIKMNNCVGLNLKLNFRQKKYRYY